MANCTCVATDCYERQYIDEDGRHFPDCPVLQVRAARARVLAAKTNCQIPPAGWWCSRKAGHGGPCAARPNDWLWLYRMSQTVKTKKPKMTYPRTTFSPIFGTLWALLVNKEYRKKAIDAFRTGFAGGFSGFKDGREG